MAWESFYQLSMCADDPDELGLAPTAFERGLREALPRILHDEDLSTWNGGGHLGRPRCCPVRLAGMLLLQMRFGLADGEVVARSRLDLGFRYALGLEGRQKPPSISSLRRFRAWLRLNRGDDFLHKRVLVLAIGQGLLDDVATQAQDSTNTDCRGAIIDTYNLVAAGIGRVVRSVAKALGCAAAELAKKWGMTRYLARSIKGQADIDWGVEAERNRLLTQEIRDADQLEVLVPALGLTLPPSVDEALALLRKVARQDVEELEDGTFKIKRGVAKGRIISVTDPEARHGHKSQSKNINGFKTHVQGTVASQFVTGIALTDASRHDSEPSPQLVEQAAAAGVKPETVLGDCAYGTGANVRACHEMGVAVLTKQGRRNPKTAIGKDRFTIDLEALEVTCPEGHRTRVFTEVKDPDGGPDLVKQFKFDRDTCRACPLREQCNSETRRGWGRRLRLSAFEEEHQRLKAFNARPDAKEILRARSAVERLISHLVGMGMRHARFFGLRLTQYQGYLTAAAYNLQRIFTLTRYALA